VSGLPFRIPFYIVCLSFRVSPPPPAWICTATRRPSSLLTDSQVIGQAASVLFPVPSVFFPGNGPFLFFPTQRRRETGYSGATSSFQPPCFLTELFGRNSNFPPSFLDFFPLCFPACSLLLLIIFAPSTLKTPLFPIYFSRPESLVFFAHPLSPRKRQAKLPQPFFWHGLTRPVSGLIVESIHSSLSFFHHSAFLLYFQWFPSENKQLSFRT